MGGEPSERPFGLAARARSVRIAGRGVWLVLRSQHNAWIHAAATAAAVAAGSLLGISRAEWCAVILACAAVWAAEAFNTAVELLGDSAAKGERPEIGRAKDAAAGGVLIAAAAALAVGLLVFGPRVLHLVSRSP